jgi:hypothetical protein
VGWRGRTHSLARASRRAPIFPVGELTSTFLRVPRLRGILECFFPSFFRRDSRVPLPSPAQETLSANPQLAMVREYGWACQAFFVGADNVRNGSVGNKI